MQRRTKRKQLKFYLDQKQYEKLASTAKQNNVSPTAMAKALVMESIGEQTGTVHSSKLEQLQVKVDQLSQEIGRMGSELATLNRTLRDSARALS